MDLIGMSPVKTNGKEIRIGIIGCGMIAGNHMMGYNRIPGVKVVAYRGEINVR